MNTITHVTREIIKRSPYVQETLKNGWLNLSQYAISIKPEVESRIWKKVQLGSIITALGRIRKEIDLSFDIQVKIHDISLKLPICEFNFPKSPDHSHKIELLYKHFATLENHFLNVTSGNSETSIFLNSIYQNAVLEIFKPQRPNIHLPTLGAVSIKFDPNYLITLGGIYQILKFLVWERINLIEIISTYTELTLIVDQKNTTQVLEVLSKNLIQHQES